MKAQIQTSMRLVEIVARLGGELVGDGEVRIRQIASLSAANEGTLTFVARGKFRHQLESTGASAVILKEEDRDATTLPRIVVRDPYAYYAKAAALLNPEVRPEPGIHPQAAVEEGAEIHASASVGAFCRIGRGAKVGPRAVLHSGCDLGDGAEIGEGTVLYSRVTIYHASIIGKNCILHSGAVIGADGFGFAPSEGRWTKIPQIGRVVIGDDVEIGANTTIDRGALDDTVIEDGVKIDNQVQIAHNCVIGAHSVIAGCTGIAGSTRIGSRCQIGGNGMILGHLEIADDVVIHAGTMISKSISEKGAYTAIFPFLPHREWLKNSAHIRHLDKIDERLRKVEKEISKKEQP